MKFRFQFRRYRLPFRHSMRTAHGLWSEREGMMVRLEDVSEGGSGAVGYGEAAPIPWFGTETVDDDVSAAESLDEWIEGEALEAVPARLGCLRNAIAAARAEIEVMTHPDEAKRSPSAEPVTAVPYLPVAALLPAGRAALLQIEPKAEIGFRVFKWKVGVGDVADELALFDDVCGNLPPGAKLRLDANGAWDRRRAERWLERCAERPVEFVEQPIAPDARGSRDVLLGLAGDYPTPVAIDESLTGDREIEEWIGAGWPGVFVVKPLLLGNVEEALSRLDRAKADVVFSSALETAVGAKRALRLAFQWAEGEAPSSAVAGKPASKLRSRALGFGVWPLFADGRFDGPATAPFVRWEDVGRIDGEAVWNALS